MLTHVEYPVEPADMVVVGLLGPRSRSFTIRPKLHGEYTLLVWPRSFPDARWVTRYDLRFRTQGDPPARVVFHLDEHRFREVLEWEWSLVRDPRASRRISLADAMLRDWPIARGELRFEPEIGVSEVRTVVWSCNQPFATENERAVLDPNTRPIMAWYRSLLEEFVPDAVWAMGDTAYSDGTEATNFADKVYDHPGWEREEGSREWLREAYRRMYRHHWSFPELQDSFRRFPHLMMWDDHEIRDGWGSEEADFEEGNLAMFRIAREVADEYLFGVGPRLRESGDAHQAYVSGPQAAFLFDTRSSRNYADPGGRIISPAQMEDFRRFNDRVAADPRVHFYFLGATVPFVYLIDALESLARAPKIITDPLAGVRDDVRDSWSSPGNREALRELLDAVGDLLARRPDLHVVNVSGDIHVANAFQIWPPGFVRPIYQVTSSALTNRQHLPDLASEVLALGRIEFMEDLGLVRRLWPEINDPNVLLIETRADRAVLTLRVLPVDGSTAEDQQLVLS